MALAVDLTVIAPCEWCDEYDLDDPLVDVNHGKLNLCLECYYVEYCESCRLCSTAIDPEEIDEQTIAVVVETPGFPNSVTPGIYEVLGTSYYIEPLIGKGGRMWSDELRLVATLAPVDDDHPPCGYVCGHCRLEVIEGGLETLDGSNAPDEKLRQVDTYRL